MKSEIHNHKHGPFTGKSSLFAYIRGYMRHGISGVGIDPDVELAVCKDCAAWIRPPRGFLRFAQSPWPGVAVYGISCILVLLDIVSLLAAMILFSVLTIGIHMICPIIWAYAGRWEVAADAMKATGFLEQQRIRVSERNKSPQYRISKTIAWAAYALSFLSFIFVVILG